MNANNTPRVGRIAHAEYQDVLGQTHTEYKDAKGNIYTEYIDAQGKVHTYDSSYGNGHFAAAGRESRAGANGLLVGLLVSCIGIVALGTFYVVTRPEKIEPLPPVVNVETPETEPAPVERVVEKPSVTIVPITQPAVQPTPQPAANPVAPQQPTDVNVTVKNSQPNPAVTTPQTPTITDSSLKTAITKKFQESLPNNQLNVTVDSGEVKVTGTVVSQEQLQRISPLLNSITGITKVTNNATVAP
ncbi:hypothetical protein AWQ21_01815 [Picosynechococcus sp. PCC 7003]|uniref:BON domain-containing protein n=1 Tax=Picosynechococcus sp. PCC 7003 TaxID=374981 RepID=UPI000810E3D7|nr:BON domain-containing protein [Picosynechococcus sp. PCC 7003]ANV83230.1 hypothetical protein AWQ21_01815 [Picosynechococcus sp. PCC 7003]